MTRVAQVNLAYNVRTLWFDPNDIEIEPGDKLVVETARGTELGTAAGEILDIPYEKVRNLKSPLKPVLRKATEDDLTQAKKMDELAQEALPIFREIASETEEEMHPVSVEYLLDGEKAVFYFEAEERLDFREVVHKLASRLHVRIDMRQIGLRDEACMIGGIAHCGQVVCCKRLGGEFKPVSIKMAKNQDLSLNPQKISGLCGRLMCCLRYEDETYKDFKAKAPKVGAEIDTPDGKAVVTELNALKETVSLKVGDEKPVEISLDDFDEPKSGAKRPSSVGEEAWDEAKASAAFDITSVMATFQTSKFTGRDKLGTARAVHHEAVGAGRAGGGGAGGGGGGALGKSKVTHDSSNGNGSGGETSGKRRRRRRRGHTSGTSDLTDIQIDEQFSSKTDTTRKPRRRKSTTISASKDATPSETGRTAGSGGKQGGESKQSTKGDKRNNQRQNAKGSNGKQQGRQQRSQQSSSHQSGARGSTSHQSTSHASTSHTSGSHASTSHASGTHQPSAQTLRPGHKSSGLAQMEEHANQKQGESSHRHRSRRRHSKNKSEGNKNA